MQIPMSLLLNIIPGTQANSLHLWYSLQQSLFVQGTGIPIHWFHSSYSFLHIHLKIQDLSFKAEYEFSFTTVRTFYQQFQQNNSFVSIFFKCSKWTYTVQCRSFSDIVCTLSYIENYGSSLDKWWLFLAQHYIVIHNVQ